MTNALCLDTPRDHVAWRHVVNLAVARGVPLVPVVLTADIEENVKRIQSADRSPRKLKAPETLRSYYQQDHIQRPDVPELLDIDTTHLTPAGTATAIQRHLASLQTSGSLQVPGPKFLQMRMPD
jgi:hypothetical protein